MGNGLSRGVSKVLPGVRTRRDVRAERLASNVTGPSLSYRAPPLRRETYVAEYGRVALSRESSHKEEKMTSEVLDKFVQLITTALGLVAALAWNDAIQSLF